MPTNPPNKDREALIEKLAAIEHERWADWQRYQHGKMRPEAVLLPEDMSRTETGNMVMTKSDYEHWERQIATPYTELSEKEKQSDRDQVMRYWPLVEAYIATVRAEATEHAVMHIMSSKTEGLFDGPDLFIKRAPIEQACIDLLGYEKFRAIKDSLPVAALPHKDTQDTKEDGEK